jgi:hypothetical protein
MRAAIKEGRAMSILSVASAEVRAVEDTVEVSFRGFTEGGSESVVTVRMAPLLAHDLNRRMSDQAALAQRWADSLDD